MKLKLTVFTLIILFLPQVSISQNETYTVTLAPFSSDKYDEFCPVFYKNGIVFCTNRKSGSLADYSSSQGKSAFNIFYIDTSQKVSRSKADLFSKNLNTPFNDGPVTFSVNGDTIYFSRNLRVEGSLKELTGISNKLGIFSAIYTGHDWEKIREFSFNSEWYNITTPFLTSDGLKLYFASDRPDGYGGSDIYYSLWKNGHWADPVNLGPLINTKGNEAYPYINEAGEFFFSSDGHQGFGGRDIFVTKKRASGWYPLERLDEPVNSEKDDFGIVNDPMSNEGYFSSNREKSVDIYHYKSNIFQFWFSEPQKENQYCFMISDTGSIQVDTLRFKYLWDLGDKTKAEGTKVKHCYPDPGIYKVNLDIIDRKTGKLFLRKLTYDVEISEIDQPFINSQEVAIVGESVIFDGLKSFCPGYEITGYYWDFGDGEKRVGVRATHKYIKSGEFDIRLGLVLKAPAKGDIIKRVVSKKIRIFQTEMERTSFLSVKPVNKETFADISEIENMRVIRQYSAEADFKKESLFQVVLLSSPRKMNLNSNFFSKVPAKYTVREFLNAETGTYSYVVDQQMSLMATYPAFSEMVAAGYPDPFVRIFVLKEPAEKEIYIIMKKYDVLTDTYFDAGNILTTSAYIMLDQVAAVMSKYPYMKLEIDVHTDNQGPPSSNMSLSQLRAQLLVNYLINRGISDKRLTAKGYGGNRPVTQNIYPTGRRLNRRIDFSITRD